jgi:hypothetical protein
MVGPGRVERPTSRLSGVRSNHLSYEPDFSGHSPRQSMVRPPRMPMHARENRTKRKRKGNEDGGLFADCLVRCPDRHESRIEDIILRKEVIQPQVPLRLPCYDFTPVADPTVAGCLLAVSAPSSGRTNSHGVTGGVYKARERIHRSLLFCDY